MRVFSGKTLCIYILIRVFHRKLHHYTSGSSDDFPGQKNILQPEGFDLLPVFRSPCEIHLEQQEQIVGHYHQLKNRFIGPKRLEQQMSNRHIEFGFLDIVFTVSTFFIE